MRTPPRLSSLVALMIGASVLASPLTASAAGSADALPAKQPGDSAPPFQLKLVNPRDSGPRVFDVRSYVGDDPETPVKLLLVSFFATWCHPCKKELPALVKMAAQYKDAGLMVVSVAIDKEPDGIAQIPEIVKEFNVVHPVASDSMNIVARRYLGSDVKLPSLVLIGRDGVIVQLHQGYGEELKNSLEGEIRHALGLGPK